MKPKDCSEELECSATAFGNFFMVSALCLFGRALISCPVSLCAVYDTHCTIGSKLYKKVCMGMKLLACLMPSNCTANSVLQIMFGYYCLSCDGYSYMSLLPGQRHHVILHEPGRI